MGFRGTDLRFATGSAERMRIDSSGNVGIGTTSPATKTHISKSYTAPTGGHDGNLALVVSNSSTADSYAGIGIGAGNNAGSFIHFGDTDDDNVGALNYFHFDDTFQFVTASQARMTIDSSGNVGIGTSAPERRFQVRNGNNGEIKIGGSGSSATGFELRYNNSGTTDAQIQNRYRTSNANALINIDTGILTVSTGNSGTERMRIDSSGRLLVGTSSSLSLNGAQSRLQVVGPTYDEASIAIRRDSANANPPAIIFGKSRGSLGGNTAVQNNDKLGELNFTGADGTDLTTMGAQIKAEVDSTPGNNDMPGRLVFSTTSDGASSPAERMRITNTGDTCFGVTEHKVSSSSEQGHFIGAPGSFAGFTRASNTVVYVNRITNDGELIQFRKNGADKGSISVSGSTISYNTSSDYRLKENVVDLTAAIPRLKSLSVYRFNFIEDTEKTVDGFLAHEAQLVVPEAVTGTHNEVDGDGKPVYQGIDQAKLVPLLTAALQEAIGRIETLETEVAALKNN